MVAVVLDSGGVYDLVEDDLELALDSIEEHGYVEGSNGDFIKTDRIVSVRDE